jgi:hypothetical protein
MVDYKCDLNIDYVIRVTSFRLSGKWYTTKETILKEEHKTNKGFELAELIQRNDLSVRDYSGLIGGFTNTMYHVVDLLCLDDGNENMFCKFIRVPPTVSSIS